MKSFEQQTADAIRTLTILVCVLAAGFLAVLGLAIVGFSQAGSDSDQLKAIVHEQEAAIHSPKHVSDIAIWCDAINGLQASLTAYVDVFAHSDRRIPPLTLKRLDCAAIEQQSPGAAGPLK